MGSLADLTNHQLNTIRLMGGEPLLNPNFTEYFVETRKLFPKSEIVLVSNGTLLRNVKDEDIDLMNKNNIGLCVSNYKINIDMNKFNKFNTHYFHDKASLYNISLDLTGSQDIATSFRDCDIVQHNWLFYKNGRLYQCCIMGNIEYFINHFNVDIDFDIDDISIDVATHTLEEVELFLKTPHQICKYCKPALRQQTYSSFAISKEDISEWTCHL